MIIIKESNYNKPIEQICVKCSSVLGVEKKDIITMKISTKHWKYGKMKQDVSAFICPICNTKQQLFIKDN